MIAPAPGSGGGRDQHSATTKPDTHPTAAATGQSVPSQHRRRELDARRSFSQRHRPRLDRIFGVRGVWVHEQPDDWTDGEVDAWQLAAEHLRAHQLYGRWQVPKSVRRAWHRRQLRRGGDGA